MVAGKFAGPAATYQKYDLETQEVIENEDQTAKRQSIAGTEIKIDGVEHIFMREDDILGVLE